MDTDNTDSMDTDNMDTDNMETDNMDTDNTINTDNTDNFDINDMMDTDMMDTDNKDIACCSIGSTALTTRVIAPNRELGQDFSFEERTLVHTPIQHILEWTSPQQSPRTTTASVQKPRLAWPTRTRGTWMRRSHSWRSTSRWTSPSCRRWRGMT